MINKNWYILDYKLFTRSLLKRLSSIHICQRAIIELCTNWISFLFLQYTLQFQIIVSLPAYGLFVLSDPCPFPLRPPPPLYYLNSHFFWKEKTLSIRKVSGALTLDFYSFECYIWYISICRTRLLLRYPRPPPPPSPYYLELESTCKVLLWWAILTH